MISFNPDFPIAQQKKKSLRAVNIIKLKRNGKFKGRMCANGAHYQHFLLSEEAKFPIINLECVLFIMLIDAYEDRKVANFDTSGVYLQADLTKEKFTILLMESRFGNILCDINTEYKQHLRFKDGMKKLYLLILKIIYGMIESTIRWYKIHISVLKDMGNQLNNYDMCVANKDIYGKQCTISWYVDDNKV